MCRAHLLKHLHEFLELGVAVHIEVFTDTRVALVLALKAQPLRWFQACSMHGQPLWVFVADILRSMNPTVSPPVCKMSASNTYCWILSCEHIDVNMMPTKHLLSAVNCKFHSAAAQTFAYLSSQRHRIWFEMTVYVTQNLEIGK